MIQHRFSSLNESGLNSRVSSRKPLSSIQDEIFIEESQGCSTPLDIVLNVDPFLNTNNIPSLSSNQELSNEEVIEQHNISHSTIPPTTAETLTLLSTHPVSTIQCNNSITSSLLLHPANKPHPIYGRRDTIFTISHHSNEGQFNLHDQQIPLNPSTRKQKMMDQLYGYCCFSKGVKISYVLMIMFIVHGLVGLIPSFLLMYSSGNRVLNRVSQFQVEQTQTFVNYEVSKVVNTSHLILQQVHYEMENGFPMQNLTEWVMLFQYLRSLYIRKSPLTALQYANYLDKYVGTMDTQTSPPPIITYRNESNHKLYRFYISQDDPFQNPLYDENIQKIEMNEVKPIDRPWYVPFNNPSITRPRWGDLFTNAFNEPAVNVAMPIYVKTNVTLARLQNQSLMYENLTFCDCNDPNYLYGVVAVQFTLKGINTFLNSTSRLYNFISFSFIMQKNGSVIASSQFNSSVTDPFSQDSETQDLASYIREKGYFVGGVLYKHDPFKYDGKTIILRPMTDSFGMSLVIVIATFNTDIFRELVSSGMTSVVVFIIILVAGTLILFVMVQLFIQPLQRVYKKLSKILSDKNLTNTEPNEKITTAGWLFTDIGEMEHGINSMKRGVSAFSKFISPSILKKVINNDHYLDVGMTIQNMSILFSSIQDFTLLAEQTDSSIFLSIMTNYFGSLTKVMEDHRGLIDTIHGDRLQVIWNDSSLPVDEHEIRSCKAAMEALEVIEELNDSWRSENQIEIDLSLNISISSGDMMYGSMGSEHRLNFTAVGDNVNIGSKLQCLNRYYDSKILISENTYQHVKNEFICYFADYILLKGKETPITVYTLQCSKKEATDLEIKTARDLELAKDYMFQNNYQSLFDVCEKLSRIAPSKILQNLLKKAKRKLETNKC